MTKTYRVEHVTRYAHADSASMSQHVAYLRPRPVGRQRLVTFDLGVDPEMSDHAIRTDYFGNAVDQFAVLTPYRELRVTSRAVIEVSAPEWIDAATSPTWEDVRDRLTMRPNDLADETVGVVEFTLPSPYVELDETLAAFARPAFSAGRPFLDAAIDLMHRIHEGFVFDPAATTVTTPVSRVIDERRGVCQDFAHVLIGCVRSLGLPARYVSGYLLTDPPPGQPRLVGADASHAWVAVWCPRHGWVDLDPTNDLVPGDRHITVAWGRDFGDVSPLRGVVLGGGAQLLQVGVSVTPDDARP